MTGYDPTRVGPNSVNVSFVNNIVSGRQGSPYLMVVTGGKSSVPGNTSADQVVGTMDHNSYGLTTGAFFRLAYGGGWVGEGVRLAGRAALGQGQGSQRHPDRGRCECQRRSRRRPTAC